MKVYNCTFEKLFKSYLIFFIFISFLSLAAGHGEKRKAGDGKGDYEMVALREASDEEGSSSMTGLPHQSGEHRSLKSHHITVSLKEYNELLRGNRRVTCKNRTIGDGVKVILLTGLVLTLAYSSWQLSHISSVVSGVASDGKELIDEGKGVLNKTENGIETIVALIQNATQAVIGSFT